MLKTVTPQQAAEMMRNGALLVDVREADERARERPAGSGHHPLSRIGGAGPARGAQTPVIFTCRTGNRTSCNAEALAAAAGEGAYLLDGGLEAWKAAGLPVEQDRSRPIEIIRQVQISVGGLVLAGVLLGAFVHPAFYALSGAVGAGLALAGISGSCMMASLLSRAPWNRVPA